MDFGGKKMKINLPLIFMYRRLEEPCAHENQHCSGSSASWSAPLAVYQMLQVETVKPEGVLFYFSFIFASPFSFGFISQVHHIG